jgi:hypothetical protein
MGTVKDIANRKHALLDRYRTALLDEMLEECREEAAAEAENDHFAWKGEFRSRDEIMELYKEGKRWDRRFLVDTAAIAILLFVIVFSSSQIVALVAPRSSWKKGHDFVRQGKPIPELTSQDPNREIGDPLPGEGAVDGDAETADTNTDVDPVE